MTFISIIIAIVMLSILVIVHEYGHYIVARKNGVFVKEFSIGFGPRIVSRVGKKTGTRFSLKAIPFGGSCTMLGAFEDEDDNTDDERSYDKKSVWARISITLAGPVFNFILAFILSVVYVGTMGYDPATVTSVTEGSPVYEAGLREGDRIVKYNGSGIDFGRDIYMSNYMNPVQEGSLTRITYERDGQKYDITVQPAEIEYYTAGFSYYANEDPARIGEVTSGGALDAAGIKSGDIITSINGTSVSTGSELADFFDNFEFSAAPVVIKYNRRGGEFETTIYPQKQTAYRVGFSYNMANVKANAGETIRYSFGEMRYQITSVYKSLWYLISGRGSLDMLSGPVGIVEVISDTYSYSASYGFVTTLMNLLSLMILLSANLGVLNLLPIPALDGGKLLLLIVEAIRRKPIQKKYEGIVTIVGAGLLFVLMIAVLVNDVTKFFR